MKTIIIPIDDGRIPAFLGTISYEGDVNATRLQFTGAYPTMSYKLDMEKDGQTDVLDLTNDRGILTITLDETVTLAEGRYQVQLRTVGDTVIHSNEGWLIVERSINGIGRFAEEVPAEMRQIEARVTTMKEQADSDADAAAGSANAAARSKVQAELAADRAAQSANSASQSAQTAEAYADTAEDQAGIANQKATAAGDSATAAAGSAAAAHQSELAAAAVVATALAKNRLFYGTCEDTNYNGSSSAQYRSIYLSTDSRDRWTNIQNGDVLICRMAQLPEGALRVRVYLKSGFSAASPVYCNYNEDTGACNSVANRMWRCGTYLILIWDSLSGCWLLPQFQPANTNYYGVTKLLDSVTSTETTMAATPYSVKRAYDLAKKLPTVTTADNGKILKVVNGVWKAVTPD